MSKKLKVCLTNKVYYVFCDNKVIFSQPIIASPNIPPTFSVNSYWYFYVVFICQRFGLSLPAPTVKLNKKIHFLSKH